MGSGHPTDLLRAKHKCNVPFESFYPPQDLDSSCQATTMRQISTDDHHSRIFTGIEDIDEYAEELVERLSPSPDHSSEDIHSLTRSTQLPDHDVRLCLSGPSLLESLQLCTQLKLQLSTDLDQTTSGWGENLNNQGLESLSASWAPSSNSVAPPGPESETGSDSELQEKRKFTNCISCTSPRTDSPVLQWIIARLEDWQHHLNRFPTAGVASQHLHNIATALTQLEEEVKLIRYNLLGHTAEPEHDGISVADDCGPEDSRTVPHTLIVHVSSNTFLFSFEQLCYYMTERLAWSLGSVLDNSVVFWHYEQDEDGFYTEKPDACATLPNTEIMRLRCTDAFKFVNSVNRAEGEIIFRVQTALIREPKERPEPE